MTLFRPHRGQLADAMAEVVYLPDFAALVAHLTKLHEHLPSPGWPYKPDQIKVIPLAGRSDAPLIDPRTGWITYIVTLDGNAVGYTNGPMGGAE